VRQLRDDERLRVIFGTRDSGREVRGRDSGAQGRRKPALFYVRQAWRAAP